SSGFADPVDAAANAKRAQELEDILEQRFTPAAETHVPTCLACRLDSRDAAIGPEQATKERRLHFGRRREDRVRNALAVRSRICDAETAEKLADRLASGAKLHRAVAHLLPADAADELAQQALVRVAEPVFDVIAAVDPVRLLVSEAPVAHQVTGELREAFRPALRQLAVSDRAAASC